MSGHRTFQVLDASRARTRRVWSRAAKERIVAAASAPDANVSAVVRAHGVAPQQVFKWRREAQDLGGASRRCGPAADASLSFVELGPTQAETNVCSPAGAACEIIVADVVLRINSDVPMSLVVDLIRGARQA